MTVDTGPLLIAQCGLKAYSVLTRMPPPHRAPAELVAEFLSDRFPEGHLSLGPVRRNSFISDLVRAGVFGGAAYDGLVATIASEHNATLVTLDRRAVTTYERLGTPFLLIA